MAAFLVPGLASSAPNLATPHGCATPRQHNDLVRHALRFSSRGGDYHASTITRRQLERLGSMRACAKRLDPVAYKRMRGFWDRRSDRWAFHRHIDAITPYGKWAIPEYIVMRESGGDPCAKNPSSTAAGYYQFLSSTWAAYGGTGGTAQCAPAWHQHEVAARAWNGGRGASHWALTAKQTTEGPPKRALCKCCSRRTQHMANAGPAQPGNELFRRRCDRSATERTEPV